MATLFTIWIIGALITFIIFLAIYATDNNFGLKDLIETALVSLIVWPFVHLTVLVKAIKERRKN